MEENFERDFLDKLIEKESCLIERLFIQHKMPDRESTKIILKINALKYFETQRIRDDDREGWSGNIWYRRNFLGGRIYELRKKGISNQEIYSAVINAKSEFLAQQTGYIPHKIYDAMIDSLSKMAGCF